MFQPTHPVNCFAESRHFLGIVAYYQAAAESDLNPPSSLVKIALLIRPSHQNDKPDSNYLSLSYPLVLARRPVAVVRYYHQSIGRL